MDTTGAFKPTYMKSLDAVLHLLFVLLVSTFCIDANAQFQVPERVQRSIAYDTIVPDRNNGDGVFIARHKKTGNWGMFQYFYKNKYKELIPMEYDSVKFIPYNGLFTVVYNKGKAGVYLSAWSFGDEARQTVQCIYDDISYATTYGRDYAAALKDDMWGWIDFITGEEKSKFRYRNIEDLPKPDWEYSFY